MCIFGAEGGGLGTRGRADLELWHCSRDQIIDKNSFIIVDAIHLNSPAKSFDRVEFPQIATNELADPSYNVCAPIDGIIGISFLAKHLRPQMQSGGCGLMAQLTSFGWIIFGGQDPSKHFDMLATVGVVTTSDIYNLVKRLWEIDDSDAERIMLSPEEIACEELYRSTLEKLDRRYADTILLKPDASLGESRSAALRRFHALERRFQREPMVREKYVVFMRQYRDLGHMIEAAPLREDTGMHYYIPHHGVAIDRKFRVVFDASAKTSNGLSLNDVVYTGARLQRDIVDILMNFRVGQIAMAADIVKMYRQVQVRPEQWDLQRILWRESTSDPIQEFTLTTVTYGVTSAPFCAVRTLVQCADDNTADFPRAAQVVKEDFYVDDLLTSTHTTQEAVQLKCELTTMLSNGGFELAKWHSNSDEIITDDSGAKLVSEQDSTSVLGILWNHHVDEFQFKVQSRLQPATLTKRIVTSEAARVYDPSGFATPITVKAKLFIRLLWSKNEKRKPIYAWDDPLPAHLSNAWLQFYSEIQALEQLRIPRWLDIGPSSKMQLHIFCDASSQAYAAVAYLRVFNNTEWSAKLLCSKTRVAPVDSTEQTIPRLELCSIVLACTLAMQIRKNAAFAQATLHIWNDNEVALYWIRKPIHQLKSFVANRVAKVLKVVSMEQTRYIPTDQNPADLPSRDRTTVKGLINNSLWWHGPQILAQRNEEFPEWNPRTPNSETVQRIAAEEKKASSQSPLVMLTTMSEDKTISEEEIEVDLMSKFLSHHTTCRITAIVMRFCHLLYKPLRGKREPKSLWLQAYESEQWKSEITVEIAIDEIQFNVRRISRNEHRIALHYWLRLSQQEHFPDEIDAVNKGQAVSRQSPLWTLTPQMGKDGLLRIYGRLGNSDLPDSVKHPIILNRTAKITRAIAHEAHILLCHGGVQTCTQFLRQQYWIVGVRILLRGIVFKCLTCTRYRQSTENQFMADLPPGSPHITSI